MFPRRHLVCAIQQTCGLVHTGRCSKEWKKTESFYIVLLELSLRVLPSPCFVGTWPCIHIELLLVFRIKTGLETQGFSGKMSSRETCDMTTKQWSTATLKDGVEHVQMNAKQELEESESDLERQLEDCYLCRKK